MASLAVGSHVLLWLVVGFQSILILAILRRLAGGAEAALDRRSERHGPQRSRAAPELDGPPSRGLGRIVVFASARCEPCRDALEALNLFASEFSERVDLVVSCQGDPEAVGRLTADLHSAVSVHVDESRGVATRWNIGIVPFAVAIGTDGKVKAKRARLQVTDLHMLLRAVGG